MPLGRKENGPLATYSDQLAHNLHLLQQQADDDEARVVAQLLHHQIRPTGHKRRSLRLCSVHVLENNLIVL